MLNLFYLFKYLLEHQCLLSRDFVQIAVERRHNLEFTCIMELSHFALYSPVLNCRPQFCCLSLHIRNYSCLHFFNVINAFKKLPFVFNKFLNSDLKLINFLLQSNLIILQVFHRSLFTTDPRQHILLSLSLLFHQCQFLLLRLQKI